MTRSRRNLNDGESPSPDSPDSGPEEMNQSDEPGMGSQRSAQENGVVGDRGAEDMDLKI